MKNPEKLWERVHLVSAGVWVMLTPPAILWWKESIVFLVFASLWANIAAHLSAALAAHAGRSDT